MTVRWHFAALVLVQFHSHKMRIEANFNSIFIQSHEPIRRNRPIVFAKTAVIAAMLIQNFHVQFRAVKINRVIYNCRRFAIGKCPPGIWRLASANNFLSIMRQQKPLLLCAANQAADFAGRFAVAQFAPAITMIALQRKKFPSQSKLLINFRKPPCLHRITLQRRMPRHKIHVAKKATHITFNLFTCDFTVHSDIILNPRNEKHQARIGSHGIIL
jgi:hypothetical protein